MWEIENNPDILALDKDPGAEAFLCNIYEMDNPNLKVPETNNEPTIDKVMDQENAEIHDVEGIMNLEECEWNEIFTIEEQETHNNVPSAFHPISDIVSPNNFINSEKTLSSLQEINSVLPTKDFQDFFCTDLCFTNEVYLAALHSNCKVVVDKLSEDSIDNSRQTNGTSQRKNHDKINKTAINQNSDVTLEMVANKSKKINNSLNGDKISNKQTKSTKMSTINKNSVSRIIDAITIDSDDNQSCIIVTPLKPKSDKPEPTLKTHSKTKSMLMKSNSEKLERSTALAAINATATSNKIKHSKLKKDKKMKKDWVDKNVKETPISFNSFFNKKFSILGSGLKISKKPCSNDARNNNNNNKMEFLDDDEQWADIKKGSVDQSDIVVPALNVNDDDDYDDDCQWPLAKDPYNENDDNNKELREVNLSDDKMTSSQKEENGKSNNKEDEIEDDEEIGAAQKWYDGDYNSENETETTKINDNDPSKDPWSNYLSKNQVSEKQDIKPEPRECTEDSKLDNLIELDDDSDNQINIIVKEEEDISNATTKKSFGNLWSHIKEFQSQLENNIDDNVHHPYISDDNEMQSVDDTIKSLNYIKDAKWLNSRNEDFIDSYNSKNNYTENMDGSSIDKHSKWFKHDKQDSPPPLSSHIPNLMEIDVRNNKVEYRSNEVLTNAESWLDTSPYQSYKSPYCNTNNNNNNNNRARRRQSLTNARSNYISPNSKPSPYQHVDMEQLFPPFKKEYFNNSNTSNTNIKTNSNNNFIKSPEISTSWKDKMADKVISNNYIPLQNCNMSSSSQLSNRYYNHSSMYNNMTPYRHDSMQPTKSKTSLSPYGPSIPSYYSDINGSYHKQMMPKTMYNDDPYNMYNSYQYYHKNNTIPITPTSPDHNTDNHHKADITKTKQDLYTNKSLLGQMPNNNKNIVMNGSSLSDNSGQFPRSYEAMQAYYYSYFAPQYNYVNPYTTNPNQCHHPFLQYEPIPYTPASPDPEEFSQPPDKPNQTVKSNP